MAKDHVAGVQQLIAFPKDAQRYRKVQTQKLEKKVFFALPALQNLSWEGKFHVEKIANFKNISIKMGLWEEEMPFIKVLVLK